MATCSVCGGYGWTWGDYPACYSCSGSGTGGFTNIACAACGGSGRGSSRQQNTCFGCGGSGQIPGTEQQSWGTSASAPAKARRGKAAKTARPRQPARPWTRNELVALVPAFGASAWGLNAMLEITGWWLVGAAAIAAVILARAWKAILVIGIAAAALWYLAGSGS